MWFILHQHTMLSMYNFTDKGTRWFRSVLIPTILRQLKAKCYLMASFKITWDNWSEATLAIAPIDFTASSTMLHFPNPTSRPSCLTVLNLELTDFAVFIPCSWTKRCCHGRVLRPNYTALHDDYPCNFSDYVAYQVTLFLSNKVPR